jgi:serine/threonine protein phosphatase PrpC
LEILVQGSTDKGLVRPNNEDNFYLNDKKGLLVVADGMGGHASGEVASKMAIDVIRDYIIEVKEGQYPQIGKYRGEFSEETNRIGSALRLANRVIYEAAQSNPGWQGMGTTAAAVMLNGNRLSIGHVGDSRVYLVRAGNIEQMTDDHSVVYEQVKRELLTKEEAQKSEMKNLLTRALGATPEVDVDFAELTLTDGDILILCTDGLSSMVSDDDILSVMLSSNDPTASCERLIDMANKNGGKDNITVITGYIRKKSWFSFLLNFKEWFRR